MMNTEASATAAEGAYLREALRNLPVCLRHCNCPDRWHVLWSGLKATGLLRSMQAQTQLFASMLEQYLRQGQHVLIAGAADTASLQLLGGLYGSRVARYQLVDVCPAPLNLAVEWAAEAGIDLQVRQDSLHTLRSEGDPWDLVFIHYTLSFMDSTSRLQMMHQLRQDLAPGGVVVCAARYKSAPDPHDRSAEWIAAIGKRLERSFAAHPELLAPLLQWLPSYAHARQQRENTMPHLEVLRAEFTASGFRELDSREFPPQPFHASDLPAPGSVTASVTLFG